MFRLWIAARSPASRPRRHLQLAVPLLLRPSALPPLVLGARARSEPAAAGRDAESGASGRARPDGASRARGRRQRARRDRPRAGRGGRGARHPRAHRWRCANRGPGGPGPRAPGHGAAARGVGDHRRPAVHGPRAGRGDPAGRRRAGRPARGGVLRARRSRPHRSPRPGPPPLAGGRSRGALRDHHRGLGAVGRRRGHAGAGELPRGHDAHRFGAEPVRGRRGGPGGPARTGVDRSPPRRALAPRHRRADAAESQGARGYRRARRARGRGDGRDGARRSGHRRRGGRALAVGRRGDPGEAPAGGRRRRGRPADARAAPRALYLGRRGSRARATDPVRRPAGRRARAAAPPRPPHRRALVAAGRGGRGRCERRPRSIGARGRHDRGGELRRGGQRRGGGHGRARGRAGGATRVASRRRLQRRGCMGRLHAGYGQRVLCPRDPRSR